MNAADIQVEIVDYKLGTKTGGEDAQAHANIIATYKGQRYHGFGLSTDIVEASAEALLHVLNLTYRADQVEQKKQEKQNAK